MAIAKQPWRGLDTWEKAEALLAGKVAWCRETGEVPITGMVDDWFQDDPGTPQIYVRSILELDSRGDILGVRRVVAASRTGDRLWTWYPNGTCYLGYVSVSRLAELNIWGPVPLRLEGDKILYPTGADAWSLDTLHPTGLVWSMQESIAFLATVSDIHSFLDSKVIPTRRWK